MGKIVNNKYYSYIYLRFLFHIFGIFVSIIFLIEFYKKIYITFGLLILIYYMFKETKNALIKCLPKEECFCDNRKFYYKKILWKFIKLKSFSLDVGDILTIEDRKKIEKYGTDNIFMGIVFYFSYMKERIKITTKDRKIYYIWIYNKQEDLLSPFAPPMEEKNFNNDLKFIKSMIEKEQGILKTNKKVINLMENYNSPLDERYNYILNKIVDEEKLFILKKDDYYIINGDSEAIKDIEIFKNMNFEEIDFYIFYVNYLSKKEYETKKVLIGYNGIDGKELTISKFKEDINKIVDEEKLFISEKYNNLIINGDSEAIKDLKVFRDINFEEIDFYIFYVNYLSKKEYENKEVLVGYNGTDGKEVTISKFKEYINEIRDSRSTFKN